MKIVFNISRPLVGALSLALLVSGLLYTSPARADSVFWNTRDLLADFFHSSERVTFQKVPIQGELRVRLEQRLGYSLPRDSYTIFIASTGQRVDGYALIDDENGEHLPITFAVKVSPAGLVERHEIVAYRETRGDEVRDERFRRQFQGKSSRDPLRAGDDVAVVSGATISSRAMATGVKRALVLVEEAMLRPQQISSASPRAAR